MRTALADTVTRTTAAEIVTRRHPLQPSSLNAETRTVEVVLSAFADVRRSYGIERLSADQAHWEIPADGVPLLDGHRTGSFRDILAVCGTFNSAMASWWAPLTFPMMRHGRLWSAAIFAASPSAIPSPVIQTAGTVPAV